MATFVVQFVHSLRKQHVPVSPFSSHLRFPPLRMSWIFQLPDYRLRDNPSITNRTLLLTFHPNLPLTPPPFSFDPLIHSGVLFQRTVVLTVLWVAGPAFLHDAGVSLFFYPVPALKRCGMHHFLLYCTPPFSTLVYCTLLYSTLLYSTQLYLSTYHSIAVLSPISITLHHPIPTIQPHRLQFYIIIYVL